MSTIGLTPGQRILARVDAIVVDDDDDDRRRCALLWLGAMGAHVWLRLAAQADVQPDDRIEMEIRAADVGRIGAVCRLVRRPSEATTLKGHECERH